MTYGREFPLISCICITKDRPAMLIKSIISFSQQTYHLKELVISYPDTDQKTKRLIYYLLENTSIPIIQIERNEEESIGEARNNAIRSCNGEYICMWDDDDFHDQSRIFEQYNALSTNQSEFEANIIPQILLYHTFEQKAYLSFPNYWACTLLCRKDHILNYPCRDLNQFECAPVIVFLKAANLIGSIDLAPHLYTYIFHGSNLMQYNTFLTVVNESYSVQDEISENIQIHYKQNIDLSAILDS